MAKSETAPDENNDDRVVRKARDFGVGLPARRAAVALLAAVLKEKQPLDDALTNSKASRLMTSMAARDRALARAIAATTLRRKGQIDAVLGAFLKKDLPRRAGALPEILLSAACQLLFLETPAHAAIDLAVTLVQQDRQARHFDKLANAVLRRVAAQGGEIAGTSDAAELNTPAWLWRRWSRIYGSDTARAIAGSHLHEAPLDLTVKTDPQGWARRLGGHVLDTGNVRLAAGGRIEELDGYEEGAWWVQDTAASIPARLLGDIAGKQVADLCAAPGGKTAQLANAGAIVTAVDASARRLARLNENLQRLALTAERVEADAALWAPERSFDAVLLDAPCTGTGTLRRHPDIAHLKGPSDLDELTRLQARLLKRAAGLVAQGGILVYSTCSLEPEEGENQVARLLEDNPEITCEPVRPEEVAGHGDWITGDGLLRILPCGFGSAPENLPGIDGFFVARLRVGAGR